MKALGDRIRREGRDLGQGILNVDGFLTHQLDPALLDACGRELAVRCRPWGATRVLTAEVSGIAPAYSAARHLGIPMVYARRERAVTMSDPVLRVAARSHTKRRLTELLVSSKYLRPTDRVLILDDFLATGETARALARLAAAGGATLVGIGAVIEKSFQGGRTALAELDVPIESLAAITEMTDGRIVVA